MICLASTYVTFNFLQVTVWTTRPHWRKPTLVSLWASPVRTSPNKQPTWFCLTIILPQSWQAWKRVAWSSTTWRNLSPTLWPRIYPRYRLSWHSSSATSLCRWVLSLSSALIWEPIWWVTRRCVQIIDRIERWHFEETYASREWLSSEVAVRSTSCRLIELFQRRSLQHDDLRHESATVFQKYGSLWCL